MHSMSISLQLIGLKHLSKKFIKPVQMVKSINFDICFTKSVNNNKALIISHIKLGEWNFFILGKICIMFQFGKGITDKWISN